MSTNVHDGFHRRVIRKLRAASDLADFTEILLEAFQEDGDQGAAEAQVVTDHLGTFWSDWSPLEHLLVACGVEFTINAEVPIVAAIDRSVPADNARSPWLGTDLWFHTATRYRLNLAKPPFLPLVRAVA